MRRGPALGALLQGEDPLVALAVDSHPLCREQAGGGIARRVAGMDAGQGTSGQDALSIHPASRPRPRRGAASGWPFSWLLLFGHTKRSDPLVGRRAEARRRRARSRCRENRRLTKPNSCLRRNDDREDRRERRSRTGCAPTREGYAKKSDQGCGSGSAVRGSTGTPFGRRRTRWRERRYVPYRFARGKEDRVERPSRTVHSCMKRATREDRAGRPPWQLPNAPRPIVDKSPRGISTT
jgi:hypothetical protein